MSKVKLKSLEEIVVYLRTKGELDEESLERLEKKYKKVKLILGGLCFVITLALLKELGIVSVFMIIIVNYYIYFKMLLPSSYNKLLLLNLFVFGEVTDGVITKYEEKQPARSLRSFRIDVLYSSNFDESRQNKQTIQDLVNHLDNKIQENQHIKIIYLKESPELCWIYTEKLNNIYNIRKK